MNGTAPLGSSPSSSGSDRLNDDYVALRHGVGAVPVGRDLVRIRGPEAVEYMQGQCSQDVSALEIGMAADALLLTPQGKLDALVRVTRTGTDELYVDVDTGYGPAVITRLNRFKLRVRAEIEPVDGRVVALRGPDAAALFAPSAPPPGTSFVVPYTWGGTTGVDLLGADPQIPADVRRCGPEAWQAIRVEAGIAVMGAELDGRTIAAEAGLLERCVSFTKGCYTGQELVARLDARGNKVARRLRAVVIDPAQSPELPLRAGAEVSMADRVVGRLTSVAWSPGLGTAIALCYLHRDVDPPCAVRVQLDDAGGTAAGQALALPLTV